MKIIKTIRTRKIIDKYLRFLKEESFKYDCLICREKSIKEFQYWRIIKARFPLDKISRIDHIIMTKRHVHINGLTSKEKKEFEIIKTEYLGKKYDSLLEGTPRSQSVLNHHHVHLLVWKKS